MEEQELVNVVTLIDEDGREVEFDHLMTFEHEGVYYIALLPMDESSEFAEDEVLLMRVAEGEEEDRYLPIEDDRLLQEVFATFCQLWDEELDAEDDDPQA